MSTDAPKNIVRHSEADAQLKAEAEYLIKMMIVSLADKLPNKTLAIPFREVEAMTDKAFAVTVDPHNHCYVVQVVTVQ